MFGRQDVDDVPSAIRAGLLRDVTFNHDSKDGTQRKAEASVIPAPNLAASSGGG